MLPFEMSGGLFVPQMHIFVLRASTDELLSACEPATNAQPGVKADVGHAVCGLTGLVVCLRVLWTLSTLKNICIHFR